MCGIGSPRVNDGQFKAVELKKKKSLNFSTYPKRALGFSLALLFGVFFT